MCDYSLMMIPNRLAVEGERLVAHRFKSGTTGLVSRVDFASWQATRPVRLWERFKDCFSCKNEPGPVVCIPPGAQLRLEGIPRAFRDRFGLDACENAAFMQTSADANQHRDAVLFADGTIVSVQSLLEGQVVTVLSLSSPGSVDSSPDPAEFVRTW